MLCLLGRRLTSFCVGHFPIGRWPNEDNKCEIYPHIISSWYYSIIKSVLISESESASILAGQVQMDIKLRCKTNLKEI